MYIVIAGGGVIGRGLAARLVENRHDVVVIERERNICEDLTARLGVLAIQGSATRIDLLEEAGIRKAEVAIAATPSDAGDLFVRQLVLEIEHPTLRPVASFERGEASIVVATLPENASLHGMSVREITQDRRFPTECVIAGVYRAEGEEFILPRGDVALHAGDQVFLAANTNEVKKAAAFLQKTK